MLLVSIPKPCHENWNRMLPDDKGRFCQVCSKTVVDFMSLSDEEVENYFLEKREQKTCGRFRNDQLTNRSGSLPQLLSTPIPFWKKFLAIVLILFGSFLTGCNNSQGSVKGKTSAEELKSLTPGEPEPVCVTTGVTIIDMIPDTLETVVTDTTECTAIMGEIAEVPLPASIIPDDTICPGPPDSVARPVKEKIFDQHGREIPKKEQ